MILNKIWPIWPQWAGGASAEASPVLRPLRGSSFFFRAASSTAALLAPPYAALRWRCRSRTARIVKG